MRLLYWFIEFFCYHDAHGWIRRGDEIICLGCYRHEPIPKKGN